MPETSNPSSTAEAVERLEAHATHLEKLAAWKPGDAVLAYDASDVAAAIREVLAARQPTAAPEGWRLVPVEPTEEMLAAGASAGWRSLCEGPDGATREKPLDAYYDTKAVYAAMLSSAPPAPVGPTREEVGQAAMDAYDQWRVEFLPEQRHDQTCAAYVGEAILALFSPRSEGGEEALQRLRSAPPPERGQHLATRVAAALAYAACRLEDEDASIVRPVLSDFSDFMAATPAPTTRSEGEVERLRAALNGISEVASNPVTPPGSAEHRLNMIRDLVRDALATPKAEGV